MYIVASGLYKFVSFGIHYRHKIVIREFVRKIQGFHGDSGH